MATTQVRTSGHDISLTSLIHIVLDSRYACNFLPVVRRKPSSGPGEWVLVIKGIFHYWRILVLRHHHSPFHVSKRHWEWCFSSSCIFSRTSNYIIDESWLCHPQLNVTLPQNTFELYAELFASGNGQEEFWVSWLHDLITFRSHTCLVFQRGKWILGWLAKWCCTRTGTFPRSEAFGRWSSCWGRFPLRYNIYRRDCTHCLEVRTLRNQIKHRNSHRKQTNHVIWYLNSLNNDLGHWPKSFQVLSTCPLTSSILHPSFPLLWTDSLTTLPSTSSQQKKTTPYFKTGLSPNCCKSSQTPLANLQLEILLRTLQTCSLSRQLVAAYLIMETLFSMLQLLVASELKLI